MFHNDQDTQKGKRTVASTNSNYHRASVSDIVTGFTLDGTHNTFSTVGCRIGLQSWNIYGRGYSSSSSAPDSHKMVRENLTPKMRYAAFFHGKRLIGVDLLVVGSDHRVGGGSPSRKKSIMIHTVDPSENWKHQGWGGTCIGKGANLVKKQ